MADNVKQIIARLIQLTDQITKEADLAYSFRDECADIKSKTEKLGPLLRQLARASNNLYERPTRRILNNAEQVLDKTLQLVIKSQAQGLKRVFTIISVSAAAIRKLPELIEDSIDDVSWLIYISTAPNVRGDDRCGLPPIASPEPVLCLIWEKIAGLCCGTFDDRGNAAKDLLDLASDNERYGRMIIEEGGMPLLLKLTKEGSEEGKETASKVIRKLEELKTRTGQDS